MLTLTRKTAYALIAMTHLAQDPAACRSARGIATRYRMPLPLLMNVLKLLTQRGLVQSTRGPRGGYTLAAPASEITVSDIIQAVEGPIHLVRCVPRRDGQAPRVSEGACELMSRCPVRASIHKVHDRLIQFLDEVTLADVANEPAPPEGRAGPDQAAQAKET